MTMQLSVCVTISLATGPYKTAMPLNLGVQVPCSAVSLCRVYLGPNLSLQINPRAFASVSAPWWSLRFEIGDYKKKTNSKRIKDLNARPGTIKPLKENKSNKLLDIHLTGIFLELSPQARATRAKINNMTT